MCNGERTDNDRKIDKSGDKTSMVVYNPSSALSEQSLESRLSLEDNVIYQSIRDELKKQGKLNSNLNDVVHKEVMYLCSILDSYISKNVAPSNLNAEMNLNEVVDYLSGTLKLHKHTLKEPKYQEIIKNAFNEGTSDDISSLLVSTDKYIGKNPINQDGNRLMIEYFNSIPLNITAATLQLENPLKIIFDDWVAMIEYSIKRGLSKDAILIDTPLYRFHINAFKWIQEHPEQVAKFNPMKANKGNEVEYWLTNTRIGDPSIDPGFATYEGWMAVFTGYLLGDLENVTKRYPEPLISTLIDSSIKSKSL